MLISQPEQVLLYFCIYYYFHEHTSDHPVFIPPCMQEYIWLLDVCVCFLFQYCQRWWCSFFKACMVVLLAYFVSRIIGIEEFTTISLSYLQGYCSWWGSFSSSKLNPALIFVLDLSPTQGEGHDELLRRRHGDKEASFLLLQLPSCPDTVQNNLIAIIFPILQLWFIVPLS